MIAGPFSEGRTLEGMLTPGVDGERGCEIAQVREDVLARAAADRRRAGMGRRHARLTAPVEGKTGVRDALALQARRAGFKRGNVYAPKQPEPDDRILLGDREATVVRAVPNDQPDLLTGRVEPGTRVDYREVGDSDAVVNTMVLPEGQTVQAATGATETAVEKYNRFTRERLRVHVAPDSGARVAVGCVTSTPTSHHMVRAQARRRARQAPVRPRVHLTLVIYVPADLLARSPLVYPRSRSRMIES